MTIRLNLIFFPLLTALFLLPNATISSELDTLLSIKTYFNNPNTNIFNTWISTNHVCNFTGITCNSQNSVQELELSDQKLHGLVPFNSICQLKSLEKLSLGKNALHGLVTLELNNCTSLKYLDLGNNLFSGPVPSLDSLSKLTHLHLNNSGFSGAFPWNSIENMENLVVLSVGDNPFDRTSFPGFIVKLTNLNWLYLSNCSIEGKIPEGIGNLTDLINLEMAQNYITGEIPGSITKLTNLWQLELYENDLSGIIPSGFGNLTNLEYFDASSNYLHGDLSEIRFLNKLKSLQLFENEFTGEVPVEFGEFKQLVNLSLYTNKLTGELPQKLGSWADFNFIDASENFFSGPIPPDMCKRGTMTELLLLQNNFTGGIPESYANCTTLTRFRVSNNLLSGAVPSGIWGLPNVNIIDINLNDFEGVITSDIGNAKSLNQLFLGNNRLSGEIPSEISQASALVSIDLSNNQFSGEIPRSFGELKELYKLHLQSNKLTGSIPESLGSCDSINDLNIAGNSLTSEIPASLGSLPSLNFLNLSNNHLSGRIPGSLSSLRLNLLDLSNNKLTGPIPSSLTIMASNGSFAGNDDLCSHNVKYFQKCSTKPSMSPELRTLIVCVLIGVIATLASLAYFFYSKKKHDEREKSWKEDSWSVKSFHVLTFTEDEILDAIHPDNLIGKGGSGNVYKVTLGNNIELAVKHIWHDGSGSEKGLKSTAPMLGKRVGKSLEFEAEVETLSSIRHMNVVKLYCSITSEDSSLLVYEYFSNGSLWDRLHMGNKMELDWDIRYDIALGAAKGLEYLHHGCEQPIIHRDVKSSNILLDEFLKPRIADFGLAKIVSRNDSTHIVAGTHGYIAPEYGYSKKVSEKSDVYSFGVVLMELVTGKKPIEGEYEQNKDIVDWVYSKLKTKESVVSLVDSGIREVYKEDAIKILRIAILCTTRLPTQRPTMRSVVQMLEKAEPCNLLSIVVSKDGVVEDFKEEKI